MSNNTNATPDDRGFIEPARSEGEPFAARLVAMAEQAPAVAQFPRQAREFLAAFIASRLVERARRPRSRKGERSQNPPREDPHPFERLKGMTALPVLLGHTEPEVEASLLYSCYLIALKQAQFVALDERARKLEAGPPPVDPYALLRSFSRARPIRPTLLKEVQAEALNDAARYLAKRWRVARVPLTLRILREHFSDKVDPQQAVFAVRRLVNHLVEKATRRGWRSSDPSALSRAILPPDRTAEDEDFQFLVEIMGKAGLLALHEQIGRSVEATQLAPLRFAVKYWVAQGAPARRAALPDLIEYARTAAALCEDMPEAREALWPLTVLVYEANDRNLPDVFGEDTSRQVRDAAQEALGHLRHALAKDVDFGREALEDHSTLSTALEALTSVSGLWTALKAVLLLFRALRQQGVALDLRDWPESGREDPPIPWCWVSARFGWLIQLYARDAERGDAQLDGVREDFAAFCLERLRTRDAERGRGPTEPSANWRWAYIRAFEELGANPRGGAHRMLGRVATQDPDARVRARAREAEERARHAEPLHPDRSPRRALLAAFWWLRQAHLIDLGLKPDPDGAQRTRDKEARYTTRT